MVIGTYCTPIAVYYPQVLAVWVNGDVLVLMINNYSTLGQVNTDMVNWSCVCVANVDTRAAYSGRPVPPPKANWLGVKIGSHLTRFCIHQMNQINSGSGPAMMTPLCLLLSNTKKTNTCA